jgi:hypothetical protein
MTTEHVPGRRPVKARAPFTRLPGHADQPAVPLADAARRLGTTPETLRMRVRRGQLRGEKRRGHWYVYLSPEQAPDQPPGQRPGEPEQLPGQASLVATLQDEVFWLRGEVERRGRELERRDVELAEMRRLLAAEQQRRLPAPVDVGVTTAPESAHSAPAGADPTQTPQTPPRPWWALWRR